MLKRKLKNYNIILASASPRRRDFLKVMDIDCDIRPKPIQEIYPSHLIGTEITDYLAKLKATPFEGELLDNDILITSDTIVWLNQKALEKPKDIMQAYAMLKTLSNTRHEVLTSICLSHKHQQQLVNTRTKVTFKALSDEEIWYYLNTYKPLDKAGAYGIQEWIGAIAITKIEGSYNNVVGLPTHLLYEMLINISDS